MKSSSRSLLTADYDGGYAEGFGMMAVEAMACGKPTIVMEGTTLPDTVFAPEGGLAIPQGDIEALYKTAERLLLNPDERRQIGENIPEHIGRDNDIEIGGAAQ